MPPPASPGGAFSDAQRAVGHLHQMAQGADEWFGERAQLAALRPVALRARKALNGAGCHAVELVNCPAAAEASDLRCRRPLMSSDSDRRTTHTCWLDSDRATSHDIPILTL